MTEIYYSFDHIMMYADYDDPNPHKHWAKHLIFSLDQEIECLIEGVKVHCKGICIESNVVHTIRTNSKGLLVFLFDQTSSFSDTLKDRYLQKDEFCVIEDEIVSKVNEVWLNQKNNPGQLDRDMLRACNLARLDYKNIDPRIAAVLDKISLIEGIYSDITEQLCETAFLSKSRLSHLFKEQVGVSLNSYLVIEKMRKVHQFLSSGESITSASVRAGFSSPSHFSFAYKNMFGFSASSLMKSVKFIQIPK